MEITNKIADALGGRDKILDEYLTETGNYQMFNTGGVEVETGEYLYALTRIMKPKLIVETGTHWGIGASYFGLALRDNGFGQVDTIEFDKHNHDKAGKVFKELGLGNYVKQTLGDSADYRPGSDIDILFLDTEPQLRFAEFLQFYERVTPGGFIIIHDLHGNMGQHDNEEHGFAWPYGPLPYGITRLVEVGEVTVAHTPNPRGMTIFYKRHPEDYKW